MVLGVLRVKGLLPIPRSPHARTWTVCQEIPTPLRIQTSLRNIFVSRDVSCRAPYTPLETSAPLSDIAAVGLFAAHTGNPSRPSEDRDGAFAPARPLQGTWPCTGAFGRRNCD